MKKTCLFICFISGLCYAQAQNFYRSIYRQDTFYTFNTKDFNDSFFVKPAKVPDGRWIIFERDSVPAYKFSVSRNAVHGYFESYRNGMLQAKGNYYHDSLWTFRFHPDDHRFRDGRWTYAIHYSDSGKAALKETFFERKENSWHDNGRLRYARRNRMEYYYDSSGTLTQMLTSYMKGREKINIRQDFDPYGNLSTIISTNAEFFYDSSGAFIPIYPQSKKEQKCYFFHKAEYQGSWRTREVIEDNKTITTIYYDKGEEKKRDTQKR